VEEIASLTSGAGSARVAHRAPGVIVVEFAGFLEESLFFSMRRLADLELERCGKLKVFFDSEKVSGFEPAFRQRMMTWQASTRGKVKQVILLRSKLLAAAISVANKLTGGGAEITSNRARWEAELVDATRNATREVRVVKLD
jgi:hypothetical protein